MTDRRSALVAGLSLLAAGTARSARGQAPTQATPGGGLPSGPSEPDAMIDLWPNAAPGPSVVALRETVIERSGDPAVRDRAMAGITRPRLAIFRPAASNGAAVLIAPGGGYRHVVVDREGYEMAQWLAARGFTAFVLFYRLPGDGWAAGADVALCDAQRAMRLIRQRHAEFAVDPKRLAVMGFSAGGHLCADLAARFTASVHHPVDDADMVSARPFCAAPIYPVITLSGPDAHAGSRDRLLGKASDPAQEERLSPHRNISADAPPHFLLHAEDDRAVPAENTLLLRAALVDAGVPVETHLFANGGHGFGLRRTAGLPVAAWPELWLSWADKIGLSQSVDRTNRDD